MRADVQSSVSGCCNFDCNWNSDRSNIAFGVYVQFGVESSPRSIIVWRVLHAGDHPALVALVA